jgi:cell fate regulator YaaT (PSP1 superfamily)
MEINEKENSGIQPEQNISSCTGLNSECCCKLQAYDWLKDIPVSTQRSDIIEVQFKNTRKEFFINVNSLRIKKGDIVAVEASPGHDIGIVSLTGELVNFQLRKQGIKIEGHEFKKVYRKAKVADLEKWHEATSLEDSTMLKTRKIASDLKLDMKIGDVEYQGDKTKAIFYYIADERVDFRELIKLLAENFKIRIEMRQIGSCGRELCCSTFITNFVSVTTNSARHQEISLNPQKLAGQCSKLKCCLNYELDCYVDAQKDFPSHKIVLETKNGQAYHSKTDIFRGIMWYTFDPVHMVNFTPVPVNRVKEIIELNKKGTKVDVLVDIAKVIKEGHLDFKNEVGQDSLTRFDDKKPKRKKKRNNKRRGPRNERTKMLY